MKKALIIITALVVLGSAGAVGYIYSGIYNISATEQHTALVFWALTTAKRQSIERYAADIVAPELSEAAMIRRGAHYYRHHCVQCHGAPGVPPQDFSKGLTPVPPNLIAAAREQRPAEIFWVVKHGLKMTGMPGWDYRFADEQIWDIVAFVEQLPRMTPADYRVIAASPPPLLQPTDAAGAGDRDRGKVALRQYGCTSCHIVPGVVGPDLRIGPSLHGIAERQYIAGVLTNTPENMVRWIRSPQSVDPLTAMPDMGVSEAHARDIAAYLYSVAE